MGKRVERPEADREAKRIERERQGWSRRRPLSSVRLVACNHGEAGAKKWRPA